MPLLTAAAPQEVPALGERTHVPNRFWLARLSDCTCWAQGHGSLTPGRVLAVTVTTARLGPATPRPHVAAAAAFTLRWRAGLGAPGHPLALLSRMAASGFSLFFFNLSPLRKCRQVQLLPQPGMEARPHRVWGPRTLSPPTSDGGPGHHEATRLRPHQGVHSHPPPRKAGVRGEGPTRFRGHLGGWPGPTLTEGTACCSRPSVHKDPAQRR